MPETILCEELSLAPSPPEPPMKIIEEAIKTDLGKVVAGWGLTRDTLNTQCREIWESGWRPGQSLSEEVGSGSDVSDSEAP